MSLFPFHLLKPGIRYATLCFPLFVPISFSKHPKRILLSQHTVQRQGRNKGKKKEKGTSRLCPGFILFLRPDSRESWPLCGRYSQNAKTALFSSALAVICTLAALLLPPCTLLSALEAALKVSIPPLHKARPFLSSSQIPLCICDLAPASTLSLGHSPAPLETHSLVMLHPALSPSSLSYVCPHICPDIFFGRRGRGGNNFEISSETWKN